MSSAAPLPGVARTPFRYGSALAPFQALWHKARTRFRRRRSSGVEHTLGKGGVASSILAGGTSIFNKLV